VTLMIRRMQKVFSSRYACTLSAAALAALLSACSPTSPTAAAKPAPAKAATAADPNPDLPEIVITASRIYGTSAPREPKSVRVRSRPKDKSS
jgi:PBP1b-binding outer membrane lipoprotein LpoB